MSLSELALYIAVGLWWVLFPKTAVRIFIWLRRRYSLRADDYVPDPAVIRGVGMAWLALVLAVAWILRR
jgi:hypothetical protein